MTTESLVRLSALLAFVGGVHGLTILFRNWRRFAQLGGFGHFVSQLTLALYGHISVLAGTYLRRCWPHWARRRRRRGRAICEAFDRRAFDALLLPILVCSTLSMFWWVRLAWTNLYPADLPPWWKMDPTPAAIELANEFGMYDVFHVVSFWLVHLWIGFRLGVFADTGDKTDEPATEPSA